MASAGCGKLDVRALTGSARTETLYRNWVLQGTIRQRLKALLQEIAGHHGFEIEELEVDTDHVHLFLSCPPKYLIGQVVGLFKALGVWEKGCIVRTVGDTVHSS